METEKRFYQVMAQLAVLNSEKDVDRRQLVADLEHLLVRYSPSPHVAPNSDCRRVVVAKVGKDPTMEDLMTIAASITSAAKAKGQLIDLQPLKRDEKRRKVLLWSWFERNWFILKDYMDDLIYQEGEEEEEEENSNCAQIAENANQLTV
jgi:hypothetical protein